MALAHLALTLLPSALVVYIACLSIYRRFFHPLAKVPGPFLPAVTKLYQTFYNGRYYLQIEKLHQKYGPIVRINPDEVHLADAEDYDKIYFMGTKYWKAPIFYNALCVPNSTFGTPPNEIHKIRRGALNLMQEIMDVDALYTLALTSCQVLPSKGPRPRIHRPGKSRQSVQADGIGSSC
jgi:hypothetical protein